MSPHPSDLTLERLLRGESAALHARAHLGDCALCWNRWRSLHIHEGLTPPEPLVAPPQRRQWMPWLVTAAAAVVALAALGLGDTGPTKAELATLKVEVEALQQKLSDERAEATRVSPPPVAARGGSRARPSPPPPPPDVDEPTSVRSRPLPTPAISPEAIQDAVDQAIAERKAAAVAQKLDDWVVHQQTRITNAVDDLVELGLSLELADEVEELLQDELDGIVQLKDDSSSGQLDAEEGAEIYEELRATNDAILVRILGEQDTKVLRQQLDSK